MSRRTDAQMTAHAARASACIAYHMAHHCTVDNVTTTYCPRCIVEAAITQALRDAERAGLRRAAEVVEQRAETWSRRAAEWHNSGDEYDRYIEAEKIAEMLRALAENTNAPD